MQKQILEIVKDINEAEEEQFLQNNKSKIKVIKKFRRVEYDYSWLDKIEETLEDLDAIVRNPRKFIIQEEEIVPVEKAKKISQETIKHLAQHTNLIQDVDAEGTITPSSVLNVHKEESFDIYENRFINSLLQNLMFFMQLRKEVTKEGSSVSLDRELDFSTKTKIEQEDIEMNVTIKTKSYSKIKEQGSNVDISTRIERIELILADFFKSPFMKELANALPVKSPIRKTNVILKNQNFQKALELWEFIQEYDVNNKSEINEEKELKDMDNLVERFNQINYLKYQALVSIDEEEETEKTKVSKYYLQKIIKDFVKNNDKVSIRAFKTLLNQEFKTAKTIVLDKEKEIFKIFKKDIKEYEKNKQQMLKKLRSSK